jgi:hypothetical protein
MRKFKSSICAYLLRLSGTRADRDGSWQQSRHSPRISAVRLTLTVAFLGLVAPIISGCYTAVLRGTGQPVTSVEVGRIDNNEIRGVTRSDLLVYHGTDPNTGKDYFTTYDGTIAVDLNGNPIRGPLPANLTFANEGKYGSAADYGTLTSVGSKSAFVN